MNAELLAKLVTSRDDDITPSLGLVIQRSQAGNPTDITVEEVREGIKSLRVALDQAAARLDVIVPQPRPECVPVVAKSARVASLQELRSYVGQY